LPPPPAAAAAPRGAGSLFTAAAAAEEARPLAGGPAGCGAGFPDGNLPASKASRSRGCSLGSRAANRSTKSGPP
jgi:hypothetical protein